MSVQAAERRRWFQGSIIPIRVTSEYWNTATGLFDLVACDANYPKLTVYKPDGSKAVDDVALTVNPETGIYYYLLSTDGTSPLGRWELAATISYTGGLGGANIKQVDKGALVLEEVP